MITAKFSSGAISKVVPRLSLNIILAKTTNTATHLPAFQIMVSAIRRCAPSSGNFDVTLCNSCSIKIIKVAF